MTFGIPDTVFKWFASYLSDRSKSVIVGGIVSAPNPFVYEVPQSCVLGLS